VKYALLFRLVQEPGQPFFSLKISKNINRSDFLRTSRNWNFDFSAGIFYWMPAFLFPDLKKPAMA